MFRIAEQVANPPFQYLNTDQQFRDAHLKDVLRTYYDTLSPYVEEAHPASAASEGGKEADGGFKYSFEDFVADFNHHRPLGFATACAVMPNVMSSAQVDLEQGLFALRELQRKQGRLPSAPFGIWFCTDMMI